MPRTLILIKRSSFARNTDITAEPSSKLEFPDEPLGDSVHDLKEVDRLKLVDRAWADAAAKWQQENKSTDDFGSRKRRSLDRTGAGREEGPPNAVDATCPLLKLSF